MLIVRAELFGMGVCAIRIAQGRIAAIGALEPQSGEMVIDACGGAVLPGLHDHHIHLAAEAAARSSVRCGPPEVNDEAALARALSAPGQGWVRGTGYHESVAGMLDRHQLDAMQPHRPLRIQHRSGRMWFFNSAALDALSHNPSPAGLDRAKGRLFDADQWLRDALSSTFPFLGTISFDLARAGVTGVTDMSARNDAAVADALAEQQTQRYLRQTVLLAGTPGLTAPDASLGLRIGAAKLHLHEAALPVLDDCIDFVLSAHDAGRVVATHCTTAVEMAFALSMHSSAGVMRGDRIEHAGLASDAMIDELATLGLHVVSQPHFIAERGDTYLRDVERADHADLYRLGAFLRAGVVLAAGSDAPYGQCDPWAGMRAAVSRQTQTGQVIGAAEALSPEAALALYLADPIDLSTTRRVEVGGEADLCVLNRPWHEARRRLLADDVQMTLIGGSIVHNRIDQADAECRPGIDPPG